MSCLYTKIKRSKNLNVIGLRLKCVHLTVTDSFTTACRLFFELGMNFKETMLSFQLGMNFKETVDGLIEPRLLLASYRTMNYLLIQAIEA